MADLGMTKLDAVNEMLEVIDQPPVSSLDTGGTSEQADAERTLDRENTRVQSQGWPENTTKAQTYAAAAGTVTLDSDTLWIKSAGSDQHRNLVLEGDQVYDADAAALASADVILDRIRELAFVDCSPKLKDVITARAKQVFQRRKKTDLIQDQFLAQEYAATEIAADRHPLNPLAQPPNVRPILPQQQAPDDTR